MEYRVELDVYNGPLDLLLYLIKRDELDIYDIPIARILDSYMTYVGMLKGFKDDDGLDINVAGDFLVMAATLMEIKSAMLLPRAPQRADEGRSHDRRPGPGRPAAGTGAATAGVQAVQGLGHPAGPRSTRQHESRFPRYPAKPAGRRS